MQRSRTGAAGPVAAGAALLLAVSACTPPAGVSEAGFAEPTTRLTLGVADSRGTYAWELAEDFARRVGAATGGAVQVAVTNEGTEVRGWNQALARRAQEGELDLALVQAQAWDALDVTTLTALYVPFLVRDEEHLDAVATDDLADDLLAGLQGSGVTGLALVPGGMRHVFTDGDPAVEPDDLRGHRVRSAYSTTIWSMLGELGADVDDPNGPEVDTQLLSGTITALDSTFALADSSFPAPATAGDVATYPLAFTLVAHDDRFGRLTAQHREDLRVAAEGTAAWAAETRPPDAEEARRFCERNPRARVVLAGDAAVDGWRAATARLASRLRDDPEVDALASRVERLRAEVAPAPPVQTCGGTDPSPHETDDRATGTAAPANVPENFPEGVYGKEIAAEELIDLGISPTDAHNHAGLWRISLQDGTFEDPGCPGSTYAIVHARVVVTLGPHGDSCGTAAGKVLFSAGWQLDGDALTLTDVRSGHGPDLLMIGIFGTSPWTRIE